MDVILKSRGHGKTFDLINMIARNKIPIVCFRPEYIKEQAKEMKVDIPELISYKEHVQRVQHMHSIGRLGEPIQVYIDELEWYLRILLNIECKAVTIDIGKDNAE